MSIFEREQTVSDPVHGRALPIRFDWSAVEHVLRDHVRKEGECVYWNGWKPMLVAALSRKADMTSLEMLAGVILDAAQAALARPIVLFYLVRQCNVEVRIALLANGAVFVLRGRECARFSTCFFHDAALLCRRPEQRFSQVAMHFVQVYAELSAGGDRALPSSNHAVFIRGENEWRSEIRFVIPENWGFCQPVSGTVHSGCIPDWEAIPRSPPRRLRPPSKE